MSPWPVKGLGGVKILIKCVGFFSILYPCSALVLIPFTNHFPQDVKPALGGIKTGKRAAPRGFNPTNTRTNTNTNQDGKIMAKKPNVVPRPGLGPRTRSNTSLNDGMTIDEETNEIKPLRSIRAPGFNQ